MDAALWNATPAYPPTLVLVLSGAALALLPFLGRALVLLVTLAAGVVVGWLAWLAAIARQLGGVDA